jgi:hypothetical protein
MGGSRATRLGVLAGALALFGVLVAVVALGGEDEPGVPQLSAELEECRQLWNNDEGALGMARHLLIHHSDASLLFLIDVQDDGRKVEEGGDCAVVFPSAETQPEYALNVWNGEYWRSVAYFGEVSKKRVKELQREADTAPNVRIEPDGRLTPIDPDASD